MSGVGLAPTAPFIDSNCPVIDVLFVIHEDNLLSEFSFVRNYLNEDFGRQFEVFYGGLCEYYMVLALVSTVGVLFQLHPASNVLQLGSPWRRPSVNGNRLRRPSPIRPS